MKSYIWLQTKDGFIQQVEAEVAISLPQRVTPAMLGLVLDYCRFHRAPGRSNKVWNN